MSPILRALLLFVRFHDGRYHGLDRSRRPEWPPSPARLFQALVSAAAQGQALGKQDTDALQWLEELSGEISEASAPVIAAPSVRNTRGFINYVPNNNDMAVRDGALQRIGKANTDKLIKPFLFDARVPLLYAWQFEQGDEHARTICAMAERLHQLGRGVDMAWALGEIVDSEKLEEKLREHIGAVWWPAKGGGREVLLCPQKGSLESLQKRFDETGRRFSTIKSGRHVQQFFSQARKPRFAVVAYKSPSRRFLFELRDVADASSFSPWPLAQAVQLVERVRNSTAQRLKKALPGEAATVQRVFISRDATEADKAARIRIVPLPSIGSPHVARAIRRVLVEVPPNCPLSAEDIRRAFSDLDLNVDQETGEVLEESKPVLASTEDLKLLAHYGVEDAARARLWRTVTPAALPERAARRRVDPSRRREEAKGGAERLREHAAAEWAVRQALRHAGLSASARSVRVQREPFEAKGHRAELFAPGTRFAKERLWHVEIAFAEPASGPLILGDGRYLGLGLMAPVRRTEGVLAFAIADGLASQADHDGLARALRRAVMARVQAQLGPRAALPVFFSGHEADGAKAGSGRHQHLAFAFDAPRKRLFIVAPHVLERREARTRESENLSSLDDALADFRELRAGEAGMLTLVPCPIEMQDDPLFAPSRSWESLTPYRVTRHTKMNDPARALEADLLAECRRGGLPRPEIEIINTFGKSGLGLFGRAKLTFHGAVAGPILIGRDRHFGGGLFAAAA